MVVFGCKYQGCIPIMDDYGSTYLQLLVRLRKLIDFFSFQSTSGSFTIVSFTNVFTPRSMNTRFFCRIIIDTSQIYHSSFQEKPKKIATTKYSLLNSHKTFTMCTYAKFKIALSIHSDSNLFSITLQATNVQHLHESI